MSGSSRFDHRSMSNFVSFFVSVWIFAMDFGFLFDSDLFLCLLQCIIGVVRRDGTGIGGFSY